MRDHRYTFTVVSLLVATLICLPSTANTLDKNIEVPAIADSPPTPLVIAENEGSPPGYTTASWKCRYQVNVHESAGTKAKTAFKQDCQGKVYVKNGSEAYVTQDDGVTAVWVLITNENGLSGWVNKKVLAVDQSVDQKKRWVWFLPHEKQDTSAANQSSSSGEPLLPTPASAPTQNPTQQVPVEQAPTVTNPLPPVANPPIAPVAATESTSTATPATTVAPAPVVESTPTPAPVAPVATPTPATAATPSEFVDVIATGMGVDANAALLNAYSNAVQQALGLYIDAETLVQNDEIVRDKILTYSKGFIEEAKQISSSEANGIFQVKIRAKVKREQLLAGTGKGE